MAGRWTAAARARVNSGVGHRVRGREVYRPGESRRVEGEENGCQRVGQRDPAHPLFAGAEPSAQAEAKDGEQAAKRAGTWPQDDAEAKVHHADSGFGAGLGGGFPLLAQIG